MSLDELLATLPANPKKVDIDRFRQLVRERSVDYLMSIEDGAQRAIAMRELLALQPDNAKGELFTLFRRRHMKAELDETGVAVHGFVDGKPKAFKSDRLAKKRTPDGVAHVQSEVEGYLPTGRYAIEDKTGPNAFKMDQAEDYARMSDTKLSRLTGQHQDLDVGAATGGMKLTDSGKSEYDGLAYVFSHKADAEDALDKLRRSTVTRPVVGRHPGGIYVLFYDEDGVLKLLTPIAKGKL